MSLRHPFAKHGIDFQQITEQFYIGTNMCCLTHFEEELLQKGIQADISLEAERIDAPEGVSQFLWLPTPDKQPPTWESCELGVHALQFFERAQISCYIHCKNGHGRAPTLFAAFLMRTRGFDATTATAFIKQFRPNIHLEPSQKQFLEMWK